MQGVQSSGRSPPPAHHLKSPEQTQCLYKTKRKIEMAKAQVRSKVWHFE